MQRGKVLQRPTLNFEIRTLNFFQSVTQIARCIIREARREIVFLSIVQPDFRCINHGGIIQNPLDDIHGIEQRRLDAEIVQPDGRLSRRRHLVRSLVDPLRRSPGLVRDLRCRAGVRRGMRRG